MGVSASLVLMHNGRRTYVKADLHTGTFSVVRATNKGPFIYRTQNNGKKLQKHHCNCWRVLKNSLCSSTPPKLWRAAGESTTHLAGGRSWRKANCTSETAASRSRPPPPGWSHTGWGLSPLQTCSLPLKKKRGGGGILFYNSTLKRSIYFTDDS